MIKKIAKIFKKLFLCLYTILDRLIVFPISKIAYRISKISKKYSGTFEGLLNRPHALILLSLIIAVCAVLVVDNEAINLVKTESEILSNKPVNVVFNEEKYVVEGVPNTVDIILMGRKSDLYLAKQLGEHEVVLDLSDYKTGEYTVKLKYNHSIDSVTYKLDPGTVRVKINEKVSAVKTLTYDLLNQDKVDKKLSIGEVKLSDSEVYVKGSNETLAKVTSVKALIDLASLDLTSSGTYDIDSLPMVAYDVNGNVVSNVEIVPTTAKATIAVESYFADLPVKVIPVGTFATGYAIESATSSVSTVRVYADQATLQKLQYIGANIDVDGLSSNKTYNVTLAKPSGVRSMSETTTTVNVTVASESTIEIEDISIETANLASNLVANTVNKDETSCTVIVKGVSTVINNIKPSTIRAYVDLTGYGVGTYDVPVKVEGNDLTVTYTPKTTTIRIKISNAS